MRSPGEVLEHDELVRLAGMQDGMCVSIYLPTHRYGKETRQNPVQLRSLLQEAKGELESRRRTAAEIDALLEPTAGLLDDVSFWQHQDEGLALFLAPGLSRWWRLPEPFSAQVAVGPRFDLVPLLPVLARTGRFYVVAGSRKQIRILEGSSAGCRRLELPSAAEAFRQAIQYDEYDSDLQFHVASPSAQLDRHPIMHGHGGGDEENEKATALRAFQRFAAVLLERLPDDDTPIVLAAAEPQLSLLRRALAARPPLAAALQGNPESLDDREIWRKARREAVQPWIAEQQRSLWSRYEEAQGGDRATCEPRAVVAAAFEGRVDTLFVRPGHRLWGRYEVDTATVTVHEPARAEDEELMAAAVGETFTHGGSVLAVDDAESLGAVLPAAILRY